MLPLQQEIRYTDIKVKSSQPPHIFALSDQAYQTMRRTAINQCCVVSGESGAGENIYPQRIVRSNLDTHLSDTPFAIRQPIRRPRLLERVYKPIHTPH